MNKNEQDRRNGNTRRELIKNAQLQCHEDRSICERYESYTGDIPREYLVEFQNSIVDYYWALRPLREKKLVEDFWRTAVLSEEWADEEGPVKGLDTLAKLNRMYERVEYTRQTMRGVERDVDTELRILPFRILVDIYGTLEDAAEKLGFTVETDIPVEDDPVPV